MKLLDALRPYAIETIALLLLGFGLLVYHEHNVHVAQEALLHQLKTEDDAARKQLTAKLEQAEQQAATDQKIVASLQQDRQDLQQTLQSLSIRLTSLQQQESKREQQVQQMSPDALLKLLREQWGAPQGQSVQGVTAGDISKAETWKVQLDSCVQEKADLQGQVSKCLDVDSVNQRIVTAQKQAIASLQAAIVEQKDADQKQIDYLQKEVKVVRGSFLQRTVSTLEKVGVGMAIGVAVAVH